MPLLMEDERDAVTYLLEHIEGNCQSRIAVEHIEGNCQSCIAGRSAS